MVFKRETTRRFLYHPGLLSVCQGFDDHEEKAIRLTHYWRTFYNNDPDNIIARKALDDLRNFEKYYRDSAGVSIRTLSINTTASEFAPVYYKDGIVFSSSRDGGASNKKSQWDNSPFLGLYHSRKSGDHQFEEPTLFGDELDTRYHDGPAMFYAQFQKMIVNRNQRIEVKGRKNVFEWRPGLYDAQFDKAKSSWKVVAATV